MKFNPLDIKTWYYYPIPMPLDEQGKGPVDIKNAHTVTYEVWDQVFDSYGTYKHLPEAVQRAIDLNRQYSNHEILSGPAEERK